MNSFLKNKAFFILFFLGIIFPLIISNTIEEIKEKTLKTIPTEGNNYLIYTIRGDDPSVNYVLSAYSDSERQNRIQLSQSYNGITKIYVSGKDVNEIYLEIECSSYPCNIEEEQRLSNTFELIDGEPINYYINKDNEEIRFSMNLKSDYSNVWVRGQKEIKSNLNSYPIIKKTLKNSFDSYIVTKNSFSELTVTATKGDYINVGFIGYTQEDDYYIHKENLLNDGPVITGFLNKDSLNKVCYNLEMSEGSLDILLINGIIYTKFAQTELISLKTKTPNFVDLNTGFIKKLSFYPYSIICVSFPNITKYPEYEEVKDIIFTYQVEKFDEKTYIEKEPQINGILYPRRIKLNSTVGFISHKDNFEKMSLSLDSIRGFPKMYVYKCENYPLCSFKKETLDSAIRPRNINRFSEYNVIKSDQFDDSPISKKQTLFVVQCQEAEKFVDENEESKKYMDFLCDFNSLINKEDTTIELIDKKFFNDYALVNEEHNYKIKLGNEKLEKVFIDIMTYVGDIEINTQKISNLNIDFAQYDSINKIFISIKTNGKPLEELDFSVKALNNTYYTILVNFANNKKDEDSFITNTLQSGMSYLVTVDTALESSNANKIIKIHNERIIDKVSYLVNFYSLNCEINVNSILDGENEGTLEQNGHFYNDLIKLNDKRYYSTPYQYKISVKNGDSSKYVQNLCKIYVSGIELSESHTENSRDILIPDNIPQQIILSQDSKHISFGYVHVDFHNDLLIKFNLIHTAKYTVKIYYEKYERKENVTIVANNLLYLSSEEWENICKDNSRVCYIRVDITLDEIKEYEKPLLELSIKSIGSNFVSYIPKNLLKKDYVQTNFSQYYYTEIGVKEKGFIIVNFLRGSGKVLARIVDKNIEKEESNANWKGKYKLPSEEEEEEKEILKMDPFTKKINFKTNDNECERGCYLLIKVFSDVISKRIPFPHSRNYPFSIIVNSFSNTLSFIKIPPISISLDEFIVGSINPSSTNPLSQYYSVTLNEDAEYVVIECQSDITNFYINIGEEKPLKEKYNLVKYNIGKDTIHKIEKNEILAHMPSHDENKGLKGIILTIGVWTNMTDSVKTTFSFAIRLEKKTQIYRVNSDQKVLCEADKKSNNDNLYRCIYVVDYIYIHDFMNLLIYANLQDKSATSFIYANTISAIEYEMAKGNIESLIPNKENNNISTDKKQKDYLEFYEGTSFKDYILISVEVTKKTIVELISSIFLFQDEITPNPYSVQLIMTYESYDIKLNFPNEFMEMINLVCVGGSGIVYWEDSKDKIYNLKGRDDRISITSSKSNNGKHQLVLEGKYNQISSETFVLLIEYNIRNDYSNFDSLNIEKSVKYIYTNSDFPIVLYCSLDSFKMENNDYYDIFFTFYNLEISEEKPLTYYESYPFTAHGFIVKETMIYQSKENPNITPIVNEKTIFGLYDQGLRTGLIRINQNDIFSSKIKDEKPYLYLKFDKSKQFKDIRIYKRISFETAVYHKISEIPVSEVSNQFGLMYNETEIKYKLRNDKTKKYMNLEFSCEDDNLEINLQDANLKKEEYGKKFYSCETKNLNDIIDLLIKSKNEIKKDDLQFFYFKYSFSDEINNDIYTIKNTKINVTKTYKEKNADYFISLIPIDDTGNKDINITYIVRLINTGNKPNKPYVSMKMGIQSVKEYYNPKIENNCDHLLFNITDALMNVKYIQVIVQIKDKEDIIFLSYDLCDNFTENNPPSKPQPSSHDDNDNDDDNDDNDNNDDDITLNPKKDDKLALKIGIPIGVLFLIVIIVLVVVILTFHNKNKDLLEKVNKVSFAEQRGDDDLLLNKGVQ